MRADVAALRDDDVGMRADLKAVREKNAAIRTRMPSTVAASTGSPQRSRSIETVAH
jgi:hypothetical protein